MSLCRRSAEQSGKLVWVEVIAKESKTDAELVVLKESFLFIVHSRSARATPNDPKLSDRGVRRGTCMVGGKAAAEAGAVTHGAVRCSAWLGVAGVVIR